MPILQWIRSLRDGKLVAEHVDALLTRTAGKVREAAFSQAARLPHAEACGYVRAKAVRILYEAVESASTQAETAVPHRLREYVLHAATRRMTSTIMEQVVAAPRSRQTAKRRAA